MYNSPSRPIIQNTPSAILFILLALISFLVSVVLNLALPLPHNSRQRSDQTIIGECSGQVMMTHNLPGDWRFQWLHAAETLSAPSGASFIRLPPRLPPDQIESDWLSVEGMRALAWGGGKWFAAGSTGSIRSGPHRRTRGRRAGPQISHNHGIFRGGRFYATAPPTVRFPDRASANGTQYTAVTGTDGLIYRDAAGHRLNLAAVAD
ncbi:MAG: hypothetical protein LQ350_004519 [Teloschistes chrysophthalmus]|nr:MAG: hypothetical protein LQ350_004519 [Niorma chrysophthalma]